MMGDRVILETGLPPGFGKGVYGRFLRLLIVSHTLAPLASYSNPFHFGYQSVKLSGIEFWGGENKAYFLFIPTVSLCVVGCPVNV